jgi:hypothetical protein
MIQKKTVPVNRMAWYGVGIAEGTEDEYKNLHQMVRVLFAGLLDLGLRG